MASLQNILLLIASLGGQDTLRWSHALGKFGKLLKPLTYKLQPTCGLLCNSVIFELDYNTVVLCNQFTNINYNTYIYSSSTHIILCRGYILICMYHYNWMRTVLYIKASELVPCKSFVPNIVRYMQHKASCAQNQMYTCEVWPNQINLHQILAHHIINWAHYYCGQSKG